MLNHDIASCDRPNESNPTSLGISATQVRDLLRARRIRADFLPGDLFADPAWDMLLDLLAARLEQERVSVSSLCIAAAVPPTTALRWIRTLTAKGLVERQADPQDGRRIFIALAQDAADAMIRWFGASRRLLAS
ncbi:MAG: transcriptional regulator [Sphingomonadales bacterium RIFCSPLOWO2_12_FULL_63_15]|nr:MAG: transcriptional regulator [Sphingomonadales bacterium RIFCSPLOWO2_12_FULL_63_15]